MSTVGRGTKIAGGHPKASSSARLRSVGPSRSISTPSSDQIRGILMHLIHRHRSRMAHFPQKYRHSLVIMTFIIIKGQTKTSTVSTANGPIKMIWCELCDFSHYIRNEVHLRLFLGINLTSIYSFSATYMAWKTSGRNWLIKHFGTLYRYCKDESETPVAMYRYAITSFSFAGSTSLITVLLFWMLGAT